jgi:hypothetical protein
MRIHLFTAATLGLLAAACQSPDQGLNATPQPPSGVYAANYPPSPPYTASYLSTANATVSASSGQVCADYGFSSGTAAFDRCVSQEQAARSTGRVNRDYTEARLTADARNACASYGLQPSSGWYSQCVGREVDARRYQGTGQAVSPPYGTDQYGNRIDAQGYRVDANGYRLPRQASYVTPSYPEPRADVEATAGRQVTRDEYGFRYDAYGNRVDRYGHVISPQSTTP